MLLLREGLRGRGALVSITCPACGSKTGYPEDSNFVACSHCRSKNLITGKGRILRFYIPFRVNKDAARRELKFRSNRPE